MQAPPVPEAGGMSFSGIPGGTWTLPRMSLGPAADLADFAPSGDGAGYGFAAPKLVDISVACRYLAAQCQVRQGRWAEATEMLGEANPFRETSCVHDFYS